MKIAVTVDPEIPVPPEHYGGIERIVALLVEHLVAGGHEIVLFAHPDSRVPCRVVGWPGRSSLSWLDTLRNALTLARHARRERFDVIHSFSRVAYLLPLFLQRQPMLMTYQRAISPRSVRWGHRLSRGTLAFSAIAQHLIHGLESTARWFVVPNAVSTAFYQASERVPANAPLVFLGRIEVIKGTDLAIEAARLSGRRLLIAGNIADAGYFEQKIKPFVDGERVRYVGAVNDAQKNELLRNAAALLMPVQWEEPFGIVMAEAFACGTPVIGLRRGAVPEIVDEGVTGYVCDSAAEMAAAVARLPQLDRRRCRDAAERRFSGGMMADAYLRIYQELLRDPG